MPRSRWPRVYKDRVYTISNGGIASAYEAKTGKVLFRARVGAGGLYYASPIAAGDRIYFASGDGVVTVIAAGDKLEVLAQQRSQESRSSRLQRSSKESCTSARQATCTRLAGGYKPALLIRFADELAAETHAISLQILQAGSGVVQHDPV